MELFEEVEDDSVTALMQEVFLVLCILLDLLSSWLDWLLWILANVHLALIQLLHLRHFLADCALSLSNWRCLGYFLFLLLTLLWLFLFSWFLYDNFNWSFNDDFDWFFYNNLHWLFHDDFNRLFHYFLHNYFFLNNDFSWLLLLGNDSLSLSRFQLHLSLYFLQRLLCLLQFV